MAKVKVEIKTKLMRGKTPFIPLIKELAIKKEPPTDAEIDEEIRKLQEMDAQLLPVEQSLREKLKEQIAVLSNLRLDKLYPRLSNEFLTWRNKEGWPVFAFFTPSYAECKFTKESGNNWEVMPNIGPLKSYFDDVKAKLTNYQKISATFPGFLPENIRKKINSFTEKDDKGNVVKEAGPFNQILIFTEAPKWKIESIPQPPPPFDPLVVGRIGDVLWLIDAFDVTPVENLVRAEWTTGPIKKKE